MSLLRVLLFLAVLGLRHICNAKERMCFFSDSDHRTYEHNQVCCNRVLYSHVRDLQCCNDSAIYFQNRQLCCSGKVINRYVPRNGDTDAIDCSKNEALCHEQICCDGKSVNKEYNVCCQDKLISLSREEWSKKDSFICCGDTLINGHTHLCCNGSNYLKNSALDCCGERFYDKYAYRCLDEYTPPRIIEKYNRICGNSMYDTRKNSCCGGILNNFPERDPTYQTMWNENRECCDSLVYDKTKKQCCRQAHYGFATHLIDKSENIYCCGDGQYNALYQYCHNGQVLEKVPGKVLCGHAYIDGINEKCCANVLPYNSTSHYCCTGIDFNVIPKNEICCNGVGMNDNKLCCEGIEPCEKTNAIDDECCYNYRTNIGQTYNSKYGHCVDGQIMHLPPGTKPCTISNFYNPDTQICCGSSVANISSGYDQCCDDKPYKSQSQQCCNSEVNDIPPTEGSCCEMDYKMYRFGDTANPCRLPCENTTYDLQHEICCEGIVHQRNSSTDCCGSSAIDTTTTECCGGRFSLSVNENMKCCGDRDFYNQHSSICRNNRKVVPKNRFRRKQSDTQRLCSPRTLNQFDGAITYACESRHAVRGHLQSIEFGRHDAAITTIKLYLTEVRSLPRGENFTVLSGWRNKNINFIIDVENSDGFICRKRYFDRFCEVIVFFNAHVNNGHVKIVNNDKFFMAGYTKKREKHITKELSYQFCREKFNVNRHQ